MALLSINIVVRQKISAAWSLASLGIAVTAVLIGAFIALRLSVVITPSLLRRWKAVEKLREGKWTFEIPVRVPQEEVASLLDYIRNRISGYNAEYDIRIERIKQLEEETSETIQKRISFTCYGGHGIDGFFSRNEIVASRGKGDENYVLSLVCDTSEGDKAYKIASFMRRLFIEWSIMKKENKEQ